MMEILSPEAVKNHKAEQNRDINERIRRASEEETRILQDLHNLRSCVEEKKVKIREEEQILVTQLTAQREALRAEVRELEERRERALAPIANREIALVEREATVEKKAEYLAAKDKGYAEKEEQMLEELHALVEREEASAELMATLDRRQAGITATEAHLKLSSEQLSERWIGFYSASTEFNAEVQRTTARLAVEEEAIAVARARNIAREREIMAQERAMADKYATLERSIERSSRRK